MKIVIDSCIGIVCFANHQLKLVVIPSLVVFNQQLPILEQQKLLDLRSWKTLLWQKKNVWV